MQSAPASRSLTTLPEVQLDTHSESRRRKKKRRWEEKRERMRRREEERERRGEKEGLKKRPEKP